jgi:YVTN family beta-propeller protein
MTLLLSTIFSSGIGTAKAEEHSVVATISVSDGPSSVGVNPTNGLVYVTNFGLFNNTNTTGTVSVINGTTNTVVATIPVGFADDIAVNPTNGLVYVANLMNNVSVIETSNNNTVVATIPVGRDPTDIAVNPTNGLVYVVNHLSKTVSVIDPSTNMVVATTPVGNNPRDVAINPANGLVYVAISDFFSSNTVSVIDPSNNNTVVATIPVGRGPTDIAVNPANGLVYVINAVSDTVSVISTLQQPLLPLTDTTPPV